MGATFAAASTLLLHFGGSFGFSTQQPLEWLFVAGSAVVLLGGTLLIARNGGVERVTGLPAWAGSGLALGTWALVTGLIGFVWDVAWHMDRGRDSVLFTAPHMLILMGLFGIGAAGLVSIALATRDRADAGWRIGRLTIPAGAAVLVVLGGAASLGFPLDDLWHSVYGIDVTMWSPTHLLMIGAASLAPLALTILRWEAPRSTRRFARHLDVVGWGAILVGLSTFQLEFDMALSQWQALYQPLLIGLAAGFSLVGARVALGPLGAIRAAAVFLLIRAVIALVIGPGLGQTVPHFPLYIAEALCVEFAFAVSRWPRPAALLSGVLIGTVGMAAEWGWTQVWSPLPWQPEMLPGMWVPIAGAIAASVAGLWFAAALLRGRGGAPLRVPAWSGALGLAVGVALMSVPLPRTGSGAVVTISTWQVGASGFSVDRAGVRVPTHDVTVNVAITPGQAPKDADSFRVLAWQGGGVVNMPLVEVAPGDYVTSGTVPTGGDWKVIVLLTKGSVLAAAPVVMPAEPDQGLTAIPLLPERIARLDAASALFLRETGGGPPLVAILAYVVAGITALVWVVAIALGARRVKLGVREPDGTISIVPKGSRTMRTRRTVPYVHHG